MWTYCQSQREAAVSAWSSCLCVFICQNKSFQVPHLVWAAIQGVEINAVDEVISSSEDKCDLRVFHGPLGTLLLMKQQAQLFDPRVSEPNGQNFMGAR